MKKVAMLPYEKACVTTVACPLFFVCWKKTLWARKFERRARFFFLSFWAEKLRAWSPFTLSNSNSYLLEDLRGAHFCKVPFVAAQHSLHMLISKSSAASFGGSSFCASGARKLEHLGLPKRTAVHLGKTNFWGNLLQSQRNGSAGGE